MVARVLMNSSGLRVSQPGTSVLTASPLDFLFNSDFATPSLVTKGQFTAASTPRGSGGPTVTYRVGYGRTINPVPYVVAVANFPYSQNDWNGRTDQFSYLAGRWHTPVYEAPGFPPTNAYGNGTFRRGQDTALSFASYKFLVAPNTSYVDFLLNGVPGGITVKYAVLDIN